MDYHRIYKIVSRIVLSKTMTESQWQKYRKQHPHAKRSNHHIIPDRKRKKKTLNVRKKQNYAQNNSKVLYQMYWDGKFDKICHLILNDSGIEDRNFGKNKHGINEIHKFDRKGSNYSSIFKPSSVMKKGLRSSLTTEISQTEREVIAFNISRLLGLNVVPPTFWKRRTLVTKKGRKSVTGSEQLYINAQEICDRFFTSAQDAAVAQSNMSKFERSKDFVKFKKALPFIAISDFIFGNTDRHSGNLMIDSECRLYAIDNGLCFPIDNNKNEFRSICFNFLGNMMLGIDCLNTDDFTNTPSMSYLEVVNIFKLANQAGLFPDEIKNLVKNINIIPEDIYSIFNINASAGSSENKRKQTADALIERINDLKQIFS